MVELAIGFLRKCAYVQNGLVEECQIELEEFQEIIESSKVLTPLCLLKLLQSDKVFDQNLKCMFYHRRFNTYDIQNSLYNTSQ